MRLATQNARSIVGELGLARGRCEFCEVFGDNLFFRASYFAVSEHSLVRACPTCPKQESVNLALFCEILLNSNGMLSTLMPGIASGIGLTPKHSRHGAHIALDCCIHKDT